MDTLRKLRHSFPLFLLIVSSLALAEEPLPATNEWVPNQTTVIVPANRQNPYAVLEWKKYPAFHSTKERIVLGIEAELVFPEVKRVGAERYWPSNRLKRASSRILPESCYYQDNYFLDRCENWTLGIDTGEKCLLSVLPEKVEIDYTGTIPLSVTTARYQIQTVGVDTVSGKGFTPIGKIVGPTQEAQIVGEFCSAFCDTCFAAAKTPLVGGDLKELCVATARIKNPYATWDWLEAFCPSCEAARNLSPEWRNFRIDQVQCVEPVAVPGETVSYSCVRSPYSDGCDPINFSTPQHICIPGDNHCMNGQRETCSADGLRWENSFTCGCGCDGNDCGKTDQCNATSKICLDSSRLSTCRADTCGSTITVCLCGCANNACRNQVCTASYCRDTATLVQCITGGCGTQTVSCGYGCANNRCNNPSAPPDMFSSPLDMSVPSPLDLAGPPTPEICDGVDNDKNGTVDEPTTCWLTIHRFVDPSSGSRCYGTTNVAPPVCSGFVLEGLLFSVPAVRWPDGSTAERVQCSKANDHTIVATGSAEQVSLIAAGWNCVQPLGHWFESGRGPNPNATPFPYRCPVYRMRYTTGTGGTAHLFSSQNESFFGTFTCEPPTRGEGLQNALCGKPFGC